MKLKNEKYMGYSVKFYYDSDDVIAQIRGFASPIGKAFTKKEAFSDLKNKMKMAKFRGNI